MATKPKSKLKWHRDFIHEYKSIVLSNKQSVMVVSGYLLSTTVVAAASAGTERERWGRVKEKENARDVEREREASARKAKENSLHGHWSSKCCETLLRTCIYYFHSSLSSIFFRWLFVCSVVMCVVPLLLLLFLHLLRCVLRICANICSSHRCRWAIANAVACLLRSCIIRSYVFG